MFTSKYPFTQTGAHLYMIERERGKPDEVSLWTPQQAIFTRNFTPKPA